MLDWRKLVGAYRIDLENRDFLLANQTDASYLSFSEIPELVDPRNSELWAEGWLKVENQGQIGSCQGNALTENCEYCYATATGKVEQFSRMFAYLVSQMYDNIRGDSGSTLSGGTKAIREKGLCRESIAPYPNSYPGHSWVTDEMYKDAQKYKLLSYTDMKSSDQIKAFIGSGIGIVQIGIAWNGSMEPDSNGCIKSWSSGGGGGHSVTFTGYLPDELVGARSSKGWWLLLKNSWGTRWGRGGFAYVDPAACDQMLRHQWTVMLGRSDMETPEPRPVHIDFTKPDNMSIR